MPTQTCQHCFATENLQVCAKCRHATYCNNICRRKALQRHEKDCEYAGSLETKWSRYQKVSKRFGGLVNLIHMDQPTIGLKWQDIQDHLNTLKSESSALLTLISSKRWEHYIQHGGILHSIEDLNLASDRLEIWETRTFKSPLQKLALKRADMTISVKIEELHDYGDMVLKFFQSFQTFLFQFWNQMETADVKVSSKAKDSLHAIVEELGRSSSILTHADQTSANVVNATQSLIKFVRHVFIYPINEIYGKAIDWTSQVFSAIVAQTAAYNLKSTVEATSLAERSHCLTLYASNCMMEMKGGSLDSDAVVTRQSCISVFVDETVKLVDDISKTTEFTEKQSEMLFQSLKLNPTVKDFEVVVPGFIDRTLGFLSKLFAIYRTLRKKSYTLVIPLVGGFLAGPAGSCLYHVFQRMQEDFSGSLAASDALEVLAKDADIVINRAVTIDHPMLPGLIKLRKEWDVAKKEAVEGLGRYWSTNRESPLWAKNLWAKCELAMPVVFRDEYPESLSLPALNQMLSPELIRLASLQNQISTYIFAMELDRIDDAVPTLSDLDDDDLDEEFENLQLESQPSSANTRIGPIKRDRSPKRARKLSPEEAAKLKDMEKTEAKLKRRAKKEETQRRKDNEGDIVQEVEDEVLPPQTPEAVAAGHAVEAAAAATILASPESVLQTAREYAYNIINWPLEHKMLILKVGVGAALLVWLTMPTMYSQMLQASAMDTGWFRAWWHSGQMPSDIIARIREIWASLDPVSWLRCRPLVQSIYEGILSTADFREFYTDKCMANPSIASFLGNMTVALERNKENFSATLKLAQDLGHNLVAYCNLPGFSKYLSDIKSVNINSEVLNNMSDDAIKVIANAGDLVMRLELRSKFAQQAAYIASQTGKSVQFVIESLPPLYQAVISTAESTWIDASMSMMVGGNSLFAYNNNSNTSFSPDLLNETVPSVIVASTNHNETFYNVTQEVIEHYDLSPDLSYTEGISRLFRVWGWPADTVQWVHFFEGITPYLAFAWIFFLFILCATGKNEGVKRGFKMVKKLFVGRLSLPTAVLVNTYTSGQFAKMTTETWNNLAVGEKLILYVPKLSAWFQQCQLTLLDKATEIPILFDKTFGGYTPAFIPPLIPHISAPTLAWAVIGIWALFKVGIPAAQESAVVAAASTAVANRLLNWVDKNANFSDKRVALEGYLSKVQRMFFHNSTNRFQLDARLRITVDKDGKESTELIHHMFQAPGPDAAAYAEQITYKLAALQNAGAIMKQIPNDRGKVTSWKLRLGGVPRWVIDSLGPTKRKALEEKPENGGIIWWAEVTE